MDETPINSIRKASLMDDSLRAKKRRLYSSQDESVREKETDRKWFLEYEQVLDANPQDRAPMLEKLIEDFQRSAWEIGKVIIEERYMDQAKRTYKSLSDAESKMGHAGGTKYKSKGIFFKFALDTPDGLYGGDCYAMKAASHELRGLNAYFSVGGLIGVNCQLMSIIDYMGFRLSAFSWLPVINSRSSDTTLRYGSDNGGELVLKTDEELAKRMEHIGKVLNLKRHRVGFHRKNGGGFSYPNWVGEDLVGPGDIEGHRIGDRYYVLDTARVFPPLPPLPSKPASFLYRQFRPEFVKQHNCPLSSDAFCAMGGFGKEEHEYEVERAQERLWRVIETFGEELSSGNRVFHSHDEMAEELHRRGINLRYLWHLWTKVDAKATGIRSFMIVHMVARVLKDMVRAKMRNALQQITASKYQNQKMLGNLVQREAKKTIASQLNAFFADEKDDGSREWEDLRSLFRDKFDIQESVATPEDLSRSFFKGNNGENLLRLVLSFIGTKCSLRAFQLARGENLASSPFVLHQSTRQLSGEDVLEIQPRIRSVYAVKRIQADSLLITGRELPWTDRRKENIYSRCIGLYKGALHSKPDDADTLLNMGNAFGDLADHRLLCGDFDGNLKYLTEAESAFSKSLELTKGSVMLYKSWANLLAEQGRTLLSLAPVPASSNDLRTRAKQLSERAHEKFLKLEREAGSSNSVAGFVQHASVLLLLASISQDKVEVGKWLKLAKWCTEQALERDDENAETIQYHAGVLVELSRLEEGDNAQRLLQEAASILQPLAIREPGNLGFLDRTKLMEEHDLDRVKDCDWFQDILSKYCGSGY